MTVGGESYPRGTFHFAVTSAVWAEHPLDPHARIQHDDAVIFRVRQDDVALVVGDDALRPLEGGFCVEENLQYTTFTEVRIHRQDVVVVEVGDKELAIWGETQAAGRIKYL